jgi:uncharacterized protein (TIGR03437 family)
VAAPLAAMGACQVYLDGTALDPGAIKFAGLTPFYDGLYEVHFEIPAGSGTDPEVRLAVGTHHSTVGLRLFLRPGSRPARPHITAPVPGARPRFRR